MSPATILLQAYLRRAAAYKALGKPLEAAGDFEHALRLEPTSKATMAERQSCLEQALQQAGLQNKPPRVAIPIATQSAQQQTQQPSVSSTQAPKSQSQRESVGAAQAPTEPAAQQNPSSFQAAKARDSISSSSNRSGASRQAAGSNEPQIRSKPSSSSKASVAAPKAFTSRTQYGGGKQPSVVIEELEADAEEQLPQSKVASSSSTSKQQQSKANPQPAAPKPQAASPSSQHHQQSSDKPQAPSPQLKVVTSPIVHQQRSSASPQSASPQQAKAPSAAKPTSAGVLPAEAAAASPSTAAALAEPESLQAGSKPASPMQSNSTQPTSVSKQQQADTAGLNVAAATAHRDSQKVSIQPLASGAQQPSETQPNNTQAAPPAAQAGGTASFQPGEAVSKLDKGQPTQKTMSSASAQGARDGHTGVAAASADSPATDHAMKRHKAADIGASQTEAQQATAASPQLSTASAGNALAGSGLPVPRSGKRSPSHQVHMSLGADVFCCCMHSS